MRKLLILILLSFPIMGLAEQASNQCKPAIYNKQLTYTKTNNKPFHFAGFIIELPAAELTSFNYDNLLLKYNDDKIINLSYPINMLTSGRGADYDPVEVYKQAFGLSPIQPQQQAEINYITNWFNACDQGLMRYRIKNIDYAIFRTFYSTLDKDKKEIDVLILGDPKEVYMIGFKGFTTTEVTDIISTIHKPNKN